MRYNTVKINNEYINSKNEKRIVIDKFRNNSNTYMITYCNHMDGICKTCSEKWFLIWANK